MSSGKDKEEPASGIFLELKRSIDRANLERKYPKEVNDGTFSWIDLECDSNKDSNKVPSAKAGFMGYNQNSWFPALRNNNNKAKMGVYVSSVFWRAVADLAVSSSPSSTRVLALPSASRVGLKRLADIANWLEEEMSSGSLQHPTESNVSTTVHVDIDVEASVPTAVLTKRIVKIDEDSFSNLATSRMDPLSSNQRTVVSPSGASSITKEIIEKRMKSWCDRILVKLSICPFTKSNTNRAKA